MHSGLDGRTYSVREMTAGLSVRILCWVIRAHPVQAVHAIQTACDLRQGWENLTMAAFFLRC
jgi:hypothetical protein